MTFLKIRTLQFTLVLLGVFFTQSAYAKPEKWYFDFKLGGGSATFSGSKAAAISTAESSGAYTSMTIGSELGFYWPVGSSTVLGVTSGGAGKVLSNSTNVSLSQSYGISALTASLMHTFGKEPGAGFYLRGDTGFGTVYQTSGTSFFSYAGSETGLALRAGAGYGFLLSEKARLLLEATYGRVTSSGGPHYIAFSIGPMF